MGYAISIVEQAGFPSSAKWIEALQNGVVYAYVAILLSKLSNLRSLRLDYSFVWQSGFPGLMLKHALFSATHKGTLSQFTKLEVVDYGSNVPEADEWHMRGYHIPGNGFPACDPEQFMA